MSDQLAWRKFINRELIVIVFVGDQGGHQQQPSSNVLSAAQTLALALQQCNSGTPSPPDKETSEIINAWLESFMPVSIFVVVIHAIVKVHRIEPDLGVLCYDKHSARFAAAEE